ncbi:MAG: hypothetical protein QNJ45_04390 [Ardenticatenaceae bacterium]|nr:hypothetical protein [Ardenticatenaceae bacterium]
MLNMHTFYQQLSTADGQTDPLINKLAQLRQISLERLSAVKSYLTWSVWG